MSSQNNQNSASTPTAETPAESSTEINTMMGFNRVDLGMDGLAGSCFATPGVTYGTKAEILDAQSQKEKNEQGKKVFNNDAEAIQLDSAFDAKIQQTASRINTSEIRKIHSPSRYLTSVCDLIVPIIRSTTMATPSPAKKAKRSDGRGTSSFAKTMGSMAVELFFGPEEKRFLVHKKVLCNRIPYFDKMFNGKFVETTDLRAMFPEDRVEAFDLLLSGVYQETCINFSGQKESSSGPNVYDWSLVSYYNLAGKLCLPDLQDQIMDAYIAQSSARHTMPSTDLIREVYTRTEAGSGLRKYVLAAFPFLLAMKDAKERST
ncbi:hypothetical protein BKA65DRAFT_594638 [Rhexocercosporidium sp. MPI-PUGE-AT-0058]|nr:hypothetical protein BKA65DRAFT_594638 [Rhexocercosporidium sp. MPI-PUGE-AT-0058]